MERLHCINPNIFPPACSRTLQHSQGTYGRTVEVPQRSVSAPFQPLSAALCLSVPGPTQCARPWRGCFVPPFRPPLLPILEDQLETAPLIFHAKPQTLLSRYDAGNVKSHRRRTKWAALLAIPRHKVLCAAICHPYCRCCFASPFRISCALRVHTCRERR